MTQSSSSLPLVIVNPTSAGGATARRWAGIASDLRTHFGAFECHFTRAANDARDIAARETKAGRTLLIACGGDGTINEVANGILSVEGNSGDKPELGILSSGTGGDFRRTLGIPTHSATAARALRDGHTRTIDVGQVTYTSGAGGESASRYFLVVSSTGMAGKVLEKIKGESSAWLPAPASRLFGGKLNFVAATLSTVMQFEKPKLVFEIEDGEERRATIINFCVCNARYFGGGMNIAPDAKLDDGVLDLVIIGDIERTRIIANIHKLYNGSHIGLEGVSHELIRHLAVRAEDSAAQILIETDGEIVGHLPAKYEIVPRALRVRCAPN